ncbi:MAG: glycoside hydrolase family 97 protein [Reichenbachiella sp.]
MTKHILLYLNLIFVVACTTPAQDIYQASISSPNQNLNVEVTLTSDGQAQYAVNYGDKKVVIPSALGFELDSAISLNQGLKIIDTATAQFDQTWEQPWGEQREIRNNYQELTVKFENAAGIKFNTIFRAFDSGFALRYEFPQQDGLTAFKVMDELTEFNMSDNHDAWYIPAYAGNRYEYIYDKKPLDSLDMVHTPLTIETTNGLFLHVHEADLTNYSSMVVKNQGGNSLKCDLVPYSTTDATKAYLEAPFATPWRTIQIGEQPGDLITNYMLLNLNDENALGDVSWVQPGKYIGVWWEMFINVGTWHQGEKHAANTENVKKYIDFAADNGFAGVLVEGWNYGWDGNWMGGGTTFEFTRPYPDFDTEELSRYGAEKDVYIIGHHETGADTENYDAQLEDAYKYLADNGMKTVKTGYVENGDTLPNGKYHHGQYFVNHFENVIKVGAKNKVMIVAHEPIKATGKRRTYPNMVSREGAKGQEYNAMGGNPTDHVTVIPFTRNLAGPFDYTPGVFDILLKTKPGEQVETTIGKELALYTIIYAPMMMANDLPENYEGHPAFQYIRDVVTDWETTKVLNGEIGEYVTIARKERNGSKWFLGSVTDENPRALDISFDFLDADKKYTATIYSDAANTHYIDNPTAYEIKKIEVDSNSTLLLNLAAGGGAAISIFPVL